MSLVSDEKSWIDDNVSDTLKKCLMCDCDDFLELNLYWNGDKDIFICKNCNHIIRGLFIDYLFFIRQKHHIEISDQLNSIKTSIEKLEEVRNKSKNINVEGT